MGRSLASLATINEGMTRKWMYSKWYIDVYIYIYNNNNNNNTNNTTTKNNKYNII